MPNTGPTNPFPTFDAILLANPQLRDRITYRDQELASPSIALDWAAVFRGVIKRVGRFAVGLVEGRRVGRVKRGWIGRRESMGDKQLYWRECEQWKCIRGREPD